MKKYTAPYAIQSIQQFHQLMELPAPVHPLISIIRFEDIRQVPAAMPSHITHPFFSIWLKKDYQGNQLKYGQQFYDFDAGSMSFFAPGQVFSNYGSGEISHHGWWLMIAPEFLWKSQLANAIAKYSFFSYEIHEALHLSDKEETTVNLLLEQLNLETGHIIDSYSHQIIIRYIELLLSYAERFYNRQFITRKIANDNLIDQLNTLLDQWLDSEAAFTAGLPSVKAVAEKLNVSQHYLSDMLKGITGKTALQHIHDKVIEKAKNQLATTGLTVSEISYRLGFEYPQSFSKLFKNKTSMSPVEFRQGLN